MNPFQEHLQHLSRRHFFKTTGLAAGRIALAGLMLPDALPAAAEPEISSNYHPALPGLPHFAPKAKRLIYLFMNGGPSKMVLLDYKAGMRKNLSEYLPASIPM